MKTRYDEPDMDEDEDDDDLYDGAQLSRLDKE